MVGDMEAVQAPQLPMEQGLKPEATAATATDSRIERAIQARKSSDMTTRDVSRILARLEEVSARRKSLASMRESGAGNAGPKDYSAMAAARRRSTGGQEDYSAMAAARRRSTGQQEDHPVSSVGRRSSDGDEEAQKRKSLPSIGEGAVAVEAGQEPAAMTRRSSAKSVRELQVSEEDVSQELLMPPQEDPIFAGDDSFLALVKRAFLSQFCCCSQKGYTSGQEKEEAIAMARAEAKREEERRELVMMEEKMRQFRRRQTMAGARPRQVAMPSYASRRHSVNGPLMARLPSVPEDEMLGGRFRSGQ